MRFDPLVKQSILFKYKTLNSPSSKRRSSCTYVTMPPIIVLCNYLSPIKIGSLYVKRAIHGLFMIYFLTFQAIYRIKTVTFSGIRTCIDRLEGEHDDHPTTTTVKIGLIVSLKQLGEEGGPFSRKRVKINKTGFCKTNNSWRRCYYKNLPHQWPIL